jgi:hypothetical protein
MMMLMVLFSKAEDQTCPRRTLPRGEKPAAAGDATACHDDGGGGVSLLMHFHES